MLAYPMKNVPYLLSVDVATGDANNPGGLGAILSQIDPVTNIEKVILYASRSLKEFEKNYTPYLLELAAAVWAIDNYHVYLYGRRFTLLTDHRQVDTTSSYYTGKVKQMVASMHSLETQ
jgi:hypothetical protein